MRQTIPGTAFLLLLLSIPVGALAQEGGTCPDGAPPRANLGIPSFVCHCSYETDERGGKSDWDFDTEPRILAIEDGGPVDGILEEGDWIVSIDGHLITTEAGGRRWSNLQPGERIRLKIRRDGTPREVTLKVGQRCREEPVEPRRTRSVDLDPPEPRLPLLPRGWLGIGLTCDCAVDTGGGRPRWTFHDAPRVGGVAPDSPASRAGIRPGDHVVAIDGALLVTEPGGEAFSGIEVGQRVRLTLLRDGAERTVEIVAGERP